MCTKCDSEKYNETIAIKQICSTYGIRACNGSYLPVAYLGKNFGEG
jgi:hypothetical protein